MKYLILLLSWLSGCVSMTKDPLPVMWDKNFSIEYYDGGGMLYASTTIILSKDSCVYIEMESGKDDVKKFMLTDAEFEEVLKKMHQLDAGRIKTEKHSEIIHDMGTTRICFSIKGQEDICVESSASRSIRRNDAERFREACRYLLDLAKEKGK